MRRLAFWKYYRRRLRRRLLIHGARPIRSAERGNKHQIAQKETFDSFLWIIFASKKGKYYSLIVTPSRT